MADSDMVIISSTSTETESDHEDSVSTRSQRKRQSPAPNKRVIELKEEEAYRTEENIKRHRKLKRSRKPLNNKKKLFPGISSMEPKEKGYKCKKKRQSMNELKNLLGRDVLNEELEDAKIMLQNRCQQRELRNRKQENVPMSSSSFSTNDSSDSNANSHTPRLLNRQTRCFGNVKYLPINSEEESSFFSSDERNTSCTGRPIITNILPTSSEFDMAENSINKSYPLLETIDTVPGCSGNFTKVSSRRKDITQMSSFSRSPLRGHTSDDCEEYMASSSKTQSMEMQMGKNYVHKLHKSSVPKCSTPNRGIDNLSPISHYVSSASHHSDENISDIDQIHDSSLQNGNKSMSIRKVSSSKDIKSSAGKVVEATTSKAKVKTKKLLKDNSMNLNVEDEECSSSEEVIMITKSSLRSASQIISTPESKTNVDKNESEIDLTARSEEKNASKSKIKATEEEISQNLEDHETDYLEKRNSTNDVNTNEIPEGKIIWARLGLSRYWPAITIKADRVGQELAKNGKVWVFWLGDHKISEVNGEKIRDFALGFKHTVMDSGKMSKMYRKGIIEAIQLCASRADVHQEDEMQWAKDGFLQEGKTDYARFSPKERAIPENFLQILQNLKKEKISSSPNERHVENTPDERPYVKEVQKNVFTALTSLWELMLLIIMNNHYNETIQLLKIDNLSFHIVHKKDLALLISLQRDNIYSSGDIQKALDKYVSNGILLPEKRKNSYCFCENILPYRYKVFISRMKLKECRVILHPIKSREYGAPDKRIYAAVYGQNEVINDVKCGKSKIEEICISCQKPGAEIVGQHPMFRGGICSTCASFVKETMFTLDDEGVYAFCTVCGNGGQLCICDNCLRVFCRGCLTSLINQETYDFIKNQDPWNCFLCDSHHSGLIEPKSDFLDNVVKMYQHHSYAVPTVSCNRGIRVLSLFDGIASLKVCLDQLNIKVEAYWSSEIDSDAITVSRANHGNEICHLGDITLITRAKLQELLPIDLIAGGSPCNELSVVNPYRKGLYAGTGLLFFEYFRIMKTLQELQTNHLFWLFENVASMPSEAKADITRFFECDPVMWDAKQFSAQTRKRLWWGNIPGLYTPLQLKKSVAPLDASLMKSRTAKVKSVRTVTTNTNSLMQSKRDDSFPVEMEGKDCTMWIPELEVLFGFPRHYTDIGNFNHNKRQKLIGKSWSIQTVKHLLFPIKEFFFTNDP